MISGLLFTYGLVALVLVMNALRAPQPPEHRLPPLWLFGMIASEAAGLWLSVMVVVTAVAVTAGALVSSIGVTGLVLLAAAALGQVEIWRRSRTAARRLGRMVALPAVALHRWVAWGRSLPADVDRTRHVFAEHPTGPLHLDLYRRSDATSPAPVVIFVHGGSWRSGHPRQASHVTIQHLARMGWTVAAIEYPLSPTVAFPEHLVGIDSAIAWIAAQPHLTTPVVLMGVSAGAHLAAISALTRSDVAALVGMYGIYDFFNRNRIRVDWPLIPSVVMKATPDDDPDGYRRASPLDLVHAEAPPSLIVGGTYDSLVPPEEGRQFVAALIEAGAQATHIEVSWAQHGFDGMAGPRARAVAALIGEWLKDTVLEDHRSERGGFADR
ncbi:alpha/beta hydrolase [soil metagenome]